MTNEAGDRAGRVVDPAVLRRTAELAIEFLGSLDERPVGAAAGRDQLLAALGGPLPRAGVPSIDVIDDLARAADPGLLGIAGPRYFGFVIGGSLPAALAADWLTSTWDQNAGIFAAGPAASVVEEIAADWLVELLGLPAGTSVGLTTGCQMAHFTCLAAARHAVLARAGWDVEAAGLFGAPEITVIVGSETHATIPTALQFLGLGRTRVVSVESDDQGRMRLDALGAAILAGGGALPAGGAAIPAGGAALPAGGAAIGGAGLGDSPLIEASLGDPSLGEAPLGDSPLIVCLQAGNVNTGSFDPIGPAIELIRARRPGAWIHIDGAFGLWAAVDPARRHLLAGYEGADSWATDGHKWLNVPYDCGYAFVRDPRVHSAAMSPPSAAYIEYGQAERDEFRWVPEYSRRARGFATYAALRSLGRDGVAEMIGRCCRLAERMADALRAAGDGIEVLNDVVLDQVLVRFLPVDGGGGTAGSATGGASHAAAADERTRRVVKAAQDDGTCWLGGTVWHGMAAMRVSVVNWSTSNADIDRSAAAIIEAARQIR